MLLSPTGNLSLLWFALSSSYKVCSVWKRDIISTQLSIRDTSSDNQHFNRYISRWLLMQHLTGLKCRKTFPRLIPRLKPTTRWIQTFQHRLRFLACVLLRKIYTRLHAKLREENRMWRHHLSKDWWRYPQLQRKKQVNLAAAAKLQEENSLLICRNLQEEIKRDHFWAPSIVWFKTIGPCQDQQILQKEITLTSLKWVPLKQVKSPYKS